MPLVFVSWCGWKLYKYISETNVNILAANAEDLGPFSLDSFRKSNLSASWKVDPVENKSTCQPNQAVGDAKQEAPKDQQYDFLVCLMRDQMIMARVYLSFARMKNKQDLQQELQLQLKESQRALGEAMADSDLHNSSPAKINAMGQVLSKAREQLYNYKLVAGKLKAMLQTIDEQVRSLKKQSTFLSQLSAKIVPNGIHCLAMHLTIEYYLLPPEKRKFPGNENLENLDLYHYALFSDNVLAASVVVNSTVLNAKDPHKHVFHVVTDKLNFAAMNIWFLLNPPGKATIHVENIDEFKWLNSSYCPILQLLESAAMKKYYFKANHPTSLSSGALNLKYRNPKYLSMLNHLRFYLPEVYPKLEKILFLDDDIVVQKDLIGLWSVNLHGKVNGAVETCGQSFYRFDKYLNFSRIDLLCALPILISMNCPLLASIRWNPISYFQL